MAKLLMKGNEAIAEAAMRAGCTCFFGYPITPQTEVAAYMAKNMQKIEDGVYLQAESEIAAINMVLGAASTGKRVMTSSSSPGVSLKTEGISYIAGSDLPCVIINVQRGGPGLGGIQPSQADYFQATRALGHGDFYVPVLAPNSIQETVDLIGDAFDIADNYLTPVMLLSDGVLGQMMEPVEIPAETSASVDKPWTTTGTEEKRNPNIVSSLELSPFNLEKKTLKRFERYKVLKSKEVRFENYKCDDADIVLVAFGATSRIVKSVVDEARKAGYKVGLFRPITLWPFPNDEINKLADTAKGFISIEMNMGQMVEDVRLSVNGKKPVEFFGRTGGIIPEPTEILDSIKAFAKEVL